MTPNTPEVPRLAQILEAGVPPEALSFYGRWWQLETWLREVVYVELRAKYGSGWTKHLGGRTPARAAKDDANAYMASADYGDALAYADVFDLFNVIDEHWSLFEPVLLPKRRWDGVMDELRQLRHRNAHCRRPHRDDLGRIEQVLRDLEAGARRFYVSYVDTKWPESRRDPVVKAWIGRKHETAERLLDHAERQYDVRFRLSYSVRPWATVDEGEQLSGSEGVVWHAVWVCGARYINVAELWDEIARPGLPRTSLLHLLVHPSIITATFSAVDDPDIVADEIGHTFDDVVSTSSYNEWAGGSSEAWERRWLDGAERLPRQVQINTPLAVLDPHRPTDSIFLA